MKQLLGKKIGMTQLFAADRTVIPVTAIDVSNWVIIGSVAAEKTGYEALRVACLRDRYADAEFSESWMKTPKKFFTGIKEVKLSQPYENLEVGQRVDFTSAVEAGSPVSGGR